MIHNKRGRKEKTNNVRSITKAMQGLTFLTSNPSAASWRGDDPLVMKGSIQDTVIHRVYVEYGKLDKNHIGAFFTIAPRKMEGRPKPYNRLADRIHGTQHVALGTIHPWFTLTRHEKIMRKVTLIYFFFVWHPSENNVILG